MPVIAVPDELSQVDPSPSIDGSAPETPCTASQSKGYTTSGNGCTIEHHTSAFPKVAEKKEPRPWAHSEAAPCRHLQEGQNTPFNLDKESLKLLKNHLWIPDTPTPILVQCRLPDCGEMIQATLRETSKHYIDSHGFSIRSKRVCEWVKSDGTQCERRLNVYGMRIHILSVHTSALRGRCKACSKTFPNSRNMKSHLSSCLRGHTVEMMLERLHVYIVSPPRNAINSRARCVIRTA